MGQEPKLDLRVIGDQQFPTGARHKGGANLAAECGADRNILQVGIRRRQTAGGGSGLVEAGVQAAVGRVDQLRERVDIGALELGELAVVEHFADDRVVGGKLLE